MDFWDRKLKYLRLTNFCFSCLQSNYKPFYAENWFMGSCQSSDVTLFGAGLLVHWLVWMCTLFWRQKCVPCTTRATLLLRWTKPCWLKTRFFLISLFVIRLNLSQYTPSLFLFGLFTPLWCFSTVVNYYFDIPSIRRWILSIAAKYVFFSFLFFPGAERDSQQLWHVNLKTTRELGSLWKILREAEGGGLLYSTGMC